MNLQALGSSGESKYLYAFMAVDNIFFIISPDLCFFRPGQLYLEGIKVLRVVKRLLSFVSASALLVSQQAPAHHTLNFFLPFALLL